ncbi:MAG TPA: UDP-N-acetylmuramate dehydrogenase [Acidimicrobiia bacterium]
MSEAVSAISSGLVSENVSLGPLTTYKSGGPARFFSEPEDRDQLVEIAGFVSRTGVEVLVIGRGSNLLVSDHGFDGLVVHIARGFNHVSYDGIEVDAGAGAPLPILARGSVAAGIAGLEFFVGVPGSVGGSVRQNAGCFGTEARDRLVTVRLLDLKEGKFFEASPESLEMSYRHSCVEPHWVVVSALFRGTGDDVSDSQDLLREITRWRKENQPGGTLNAGSVFKNPEGTSAGFLIEKAGLKGHAIGDVAVSRKHANFFVAGPRAASSDIRRLIYEVRDLVHAREGVLLEPEIQMVGFR